MRPSASRSRGHQARGTRRLSRLLVVQGLYQWALSGESPTQIELYLAESDEFKAADQAYFQTCFRGVLESQAALQALIEAALDRPWAQVSPVEQGILMLGVFELRDAPEVPYRVVINEAVELSKSLGGNEGHRYVNGVLDRMAPQLRPNECKAEAARGQ